MNVQVVNTQLGEGIYFDTDPLGGRVLLLHPEHAELVEMLQATGLTFAPSIYQQAGLDPDVPPELIQEWMENNP